jgi:hypothetical protein
MTTKGTGITREEAEIIIGMIDPSAVQESSIPVLKKLHVAYPDLLKNTSYPALIQRYDEKAKLSKADFTKKIAERIKAIYTLFDECEQISIKAGIPFTFDMNGTYGMGGRFDPADERWISSSENC